MIKIYQRRENLSVIFVFLPFFMYIFFLFTFLKKVSCIPSNIIFEGRGTTQGFPKENLPGIPSRRDRLENLKPVVVALPSKKALQKKVRFFCQPFFVSNGIFEGRATTQGKSQIKILFKTKKA